MPDEGEVRMLPDGSVGIRWKLNTYHVYLDGKFMYATTGYDVRKVMRTVCSAQNCKVRDGRIELKEIQ
jgi:hypothetical protein